LVLIKLVYGNKRNVVIKIVLFLGIFFVLFCFFGGVGWGWGRGVIMAVKIDLSLLHKLRE